MASKEMRCKSCQWYETCVDADDDTVVRCEDYIDSGREEIPLDGRILRRDKQAFLRDWWNYLKEYD